MLRNHLKIAWRIFNKKKLYSFINLVGLSVAIAFTLLVVLFVSDEFTHDSAHKNADRLYLMHDVEFKTENLDDGYDLFTTGPLEHLSKGVQQPLALANLIETNIPEIEELVRIERNNTTILKDGKLQSEAISYVNPSFFKVFDPTFVVGDASTALRELDDVVITDDVAMKYLGRLDVMGELLQLGGEEGKSYRISGVIEKPEKTVLKLGVIVRTEQSYIYKEYRDSWGYSGTAFFMLLNPSVNPELVADKIDQLYRSEQPDRIENYRGYRKLSEANPVTTFKLKNIRDIYLDPTLSYGKSSAPLYSYILISVALIILIIACLNYISISISLTSVRSTEVALRRVMGSGKSQVNLQFYTEAFLTTFMAVLLGYSIMQLSLPAFNELAGKELSMGWQQHFFTALSALSLVALVSFLAGVIPARIMSRINIVKGLKSNESHRVSPRLISGMVVFQFTLCIFFVGMGLTMHQQFNYIQEKDLGFDKEQLVYLGDSWGITDKLKVALNQEPSIASTSGISGLFGYGGSLGNLMVLGKEYRSKRVGVDYGFIETLGLELVSGRDFDPGRNRENEQTKIIVNETMHKLMLQDTAMSSRFPEVIGVVKDFNYQSLVDEVGPISFDLRGANMIGSLYAKIQPGKTKEGIQAIQAAYAEISPNGSGEVRFMDSYLAAQYKGYYRWSSVINLAAIITVLIAASGLFGLTAINVMNRMREMGIRKVLGASPRDILLILNKQTIWLLAGAMSLAFPLWYYFSNNWVEGFAYHISVGAGLFIVATVLCFMIVILTISFHGIKTSRINPTTLLRTE